MTMSRKMPAPSAAPVGHMGRRSLSVVIPILNEAGGIDTLVARLRESLEKIGRPFEVIFIDDGSSDPSLERLRQAHTADPRIKAVSLSRNFGKEIAVAAGLRYASGDGVVIMDGDLQHPPAVIAEFVAKWDEGFEIVYGQRRDRDHEPAMQRVFSRVFYRIFQNMSGTELPDGAGDFRLLDRKAVDALNRIGERSRFNKGLYAWIGFKTIGVVFDVAPRLDGRSRWKPRRLLRFALDGLASFTTLPLRVWSYLGLVVSAFAFFYAVVFTVKTLLWGVDLPGFPTLIVSVMFFAGVQLISLGVMGEYLGRVYEEVKGRPLFIVADRVGVAEPRTEPTRQGACDETRSLIP